MTELYYSDLFIINGKGCVIMGHGKSKTCRNFTGSDTVELMTDSLRFDCDGNILIAYGDAAMGYYPLDPAKAPHTIVDYFIYMQDESETTDNKISSITADEFCNLADFNITFQAIDTNSRREEFTRLIEGKQINYISVPWCKDMETKGALISEYIK